MSLTNTEPLVKIRKFLIMKTRPVIDDSEQLESMKSSNKPVTSYGFPLIPRKSDAIVTVEHIRQIQEEA